MRRGRPRWVLAAATLVLVALVGAAAGYLYGRSAPQQVSVSADVLVESDVSLTGDLQVFEVTERDVATQRAIIASPPVAEAASAATGLDLGPASTSTAQDSNVITVDVVQPTARQAAGVLDAYLDAYFALTADKQRQQLAAEVTTTQRLAQATTVSMASLDAALNASSSPPERAALLNAQTAQRTALAEQLNDAQERQGRLQDALDRLPLNVSRVSSQPVPELTGFTTSQWTLVGAAAGAALGALVLFRLVERRRP